MIVKLVILFSALLLLLAFFAARLSRAGTSADRAIGRDPEAGLTPEHGPHGKPKEEPANLKRMGRH